MMKHTTENKLYSENQPTHCNHRIPEVRSPSQSSYTIWMMLTWKWQLVPKNI